MGTAWRRFVLQFNVLEQQQFDNFKQTISSILQEVNANKIEEVDTNISKISIIIMFVHVSCFLKGPHVYCFIVFSKIELKFVFTGF